MSSVARCGLHPERMETTFRRRRNDDRSQRIRLPPSARTSPILTQPRDATDDTAVATIGDDTISGLGGNDILVGGAGNDDLNGRAGADPARWLGQRPASRCCQRHPGRRHRRGHVYLRRNRCCERCQHRRLQLCRWRYDRSVAAARCGLYHGPAGFRLRPGCAIRFEHHPAGRSQRRRRQLRRCGDADGLRHEQPRPRQGQVRANGPRAAGVGKTGAATANPMPQILRVWKPQGDDVDMNALESAVEMQPFNRAPATLCFIIIERSLT